ncbi:MAG: peptidylprolyl isomerase [Deltaproteobacteria bacterium]|nr:peptidylprolyl isomerase [Deltaproteobacteria bacterium]
MNKKIISRIYILVCLALLFASKGSNAAELMDKIVAVVNDDLITLSELNEMAVKVNSNPDAPKEDQRAVLDQMIELKLLDQEAKKLGLSVSEREVDAAIEAVKRQYNLTDEQMDEVLKKQNLTPEAFREQWRFQILGNKVIGTQVKGQIAVTEDEIKKYYEENYGEHDTGKEMHIAHILIPFDSPAEKEKARDLALEITEKARSGEDFGELAKKYSNDTVSAERGGDLGFVQKGDLVASLEEAIKEMPVGEISDPVESPSGFHVIKVLDKRESSEISIDDAREEIKQKIYRQKAESALKTWVEGVRKTAYIEVKL